MNKTNNQNKMRNIIIAALLATSSTISAQTETTQYRPGVTEEGAVYFLPKTEIRISVLVEKSTYTPGDFCQYARKCLRLNNVGQNPTKNHKITSIKILPQGVIDKSKGYAVTFNPKTAASNIVLSEEGILLAINSDAKEMEVPQTFTAAPKISQKNPRDYLSEEILTAGSTVKMAELTAQEIYDIRESKNLLTRGQADFMPKDGEQLRLMLENLDKQDKAMTQLFAGTVEKDTTEHVFFITPDKGYQKQILFRLSQQLGIVDNDDLSGSPFYIDIEELASLPVKEESPTTKKKETKNGIYVNVPGKIKVSLYNGNNIMTCSEIMAAQYGYTEFLSGDLFNKRYTTHLTLSPITGAILKLDAEMPK